MSSTFLQRKKKTNAFYQAVSNANLRQPLFFIKKCKNLLQNRNVCVIIFNDVLIFKCVDEDSVFSHFRNRELATAGSEYG